MHHLLSGTLTNKNVFYRFYILDAARYFRRPVDTLLGINSAAQPHHAVCSGHVDLGNLKQRVTQNFRLNLGCNSGIIYVFSCFFGFLDYRFFCPLDFLPAFSAA